MAGDIHIGMCTSRRVVCDDVVIWVIQNYYDSGCCVADKNLLTCKCLSPLWTCHLGGQPFHWLLIACYFCFFVSLTSCS